VTQNYFLKTYCGGLFWFLPCQLNRWLSLLRSFSYLNLNRHICARSIVSHPPMFTLLMSSIGSQLGVPVNQHKFLNSCLMRFACKIRCVKQHWMFVVAYLWRHTDVCVIKAILFCRIIGSLLDMLRKYTQIRVYLSFQKNSCTALHNIISTDASWVTSRFSQ